mgnify:FL=1
MKKSTVFLIYLILLFILSVYVQNGNAENVTSKYLLNAGFDNGTAGSLGTNAPEGWSLETFRTSNLQSKLSNAAKGDGLIAAGQNHWQLYLFSGILKGKAYQKITNIPNGHYLLSADIVTTSFTGVVRLYMNDATTTVEPNKAAKYEVEVNVTNGTLELGLGVNLDSKRTTIDMDNFTLSQTSSTTVSAAKNTEKLIYIPDEWTNQGSQKLYAESDPNNEYTWSQSRMIQNDDIVIFWDKDYGNTRPDGLSTSDFYYVDIDDLMKKCQEYYDMNYHKLGFVKPATTNLNRYKMMVLISHTKTWTCYGAGYDYEINALWINPATCKPVGFAVAHEVGHSFHYMCYADASGNNHTSSSTVGTGMHLPVGSGQTMWEMTAQWQAAQSIPSAMFTESIGAFRNTHSLAYTHEVHRYQSYWFHYYLCQHYNDIQTVANVWNQPMMGAVDFNQSLMVNKNLTPSDLYKLYFDYAMRCVTWDFDACKDYRDKYVGDFNYRCVSKGKNKYQVSMLNCPQGTGFNVVPLDVPEAGTSVKVHFTGLPSGSALLDDDPGQWIRGIDNYITLDADKRVYSKVSNPESRGFRIGFVALMKDGTRKYFYEDKVYCQGDAEKTEDVTMTTPQNVSKLWMVVSPAPSQYYQHKWNNDITDDDMWPYAFELEGTTLGSKAVVYTNPTLDGRKIADAKLTYDVYFPSKTGSDYSGTSLTLSGEALATLGTAFQLKEADLKAQIVNYAAGGPENGKIMFYGEDAKGNLVEKAHTANGYGYWYDANGNVSDYYSGYAYAEFTPSTLTFNIGQYPGKNTNGAVRTIRQALKYKNSDGETAVVSFIFNIHFDSSKTEARLADVQYAGGTSTGIASLEAFEKGKKNDAIYNLNGVKMNVKNINDLPKGIYIVNNKKYIVK